MGLTFIEEALIKAGWTPPPKKPYPPKEPLRVWTSRDFSIISPTRNYPDDIELIEVGYCQLIPHDGSEKSPVDLLSVKGLANEVVVQKENGLQKVVRPACVEWSTVTHYAIILPVEPE